MLSYASFVKLERFLNFKYLSLDECKLEFGNALLILDKGEFTKLLKFQVA